MDNIYYDMRQWPKENPHYPSSRAMAKNPQDQRQKLAVIRQNLLELQAYVAAGTGPKRDAYLAKIREQLSRLGDAERQGEFFARLATEQQAPEKGPLVPGSDFELAQLADDLSFYRKLVAVLEGYFRELGDEKPSFFGRFVGIMKLAELKKVFTGWQHQATQHTEATQGMARAVSQVANACRWYRRKGAGVKADPEREAETAADVLASINRGIDKLNSKISTGIAIVRDEEQRIRKIGAWEATAAEKIVSAQNGEAIANPGMDKVLDAANAMSSVPHGAFLANRSYLWQARRMLQAQEVSQSLPEGLPLPLPKLMEDGQW